ncbi:MAG: hypothetical protein ACRBFS_08200 [Aureispira sp.]
MQLYLEKPEEAQFWEINWQGTITTERTGTIKETGQTVTQTHSTITTAFEAWRTAALAKLQEGYQDPTGKTTVAQLDRTVYVHYLEAQQYEKAMHWLGYFGHIEDPTLEDQLIARYIQDKNYTAAEKYVLGHLQSSQNANIIIRQIRYLTTVNPMLSRFMLGNLPLEVTPENPASYYKELAQAQAKIAFFDTLSPQLRAIQDKKLQLVYCTHLLDTPHENNTQQILALEKAHLLLQELEAPMEWIKQGYQTLLDGAQGIGETSIAATLQEALQTLSVSEEA